MGYPSGAGPNTIETAPLAGVCGTSPVAAAAIDAIEGISKWPALFLRAKYVSPTELACDRNEPARYEMQPLVRWQAATTPASPFTATWPATIGQGTTGPGGGRWPHPVGSAAARYVVNHSVSSELSERCTGATARFGSVMPGFMAAIFGSFQLVILPMYIAAMVGPSRFRRPVTPGTLAITTIGATTRGTFSSAGYCCICAAER